MDAPSVKHEAHRVFSLFPILRQMSTRGPLLAHKCFEDANAILWEAAKIEDVAENKGLTFAEAAPRPGWIENGIYILQQILRIFFMGKEEDESGTIAGTRYRLLVTKAREALQALRELQRLDHQQQEQKRREWEQPIDTPTDGSANGESEPYQV